jgi:hypothetical protein
VTPLGAAAGPGSLSLPGAGGGHHGGGSWGGARPLGASSGGLSKLALTGGGLSCGGEGHNSSCPNIPHAQVSWVGRRGWEGASAAAPL